ncbi:MULTISPECIES: FRG domain-containing protein [Luteibacter]|uniref:FRG domain-containing protein n=1 Tax=Luteibacter TaxID=242605 RepID=UPI0009DE1D8A|nr:MULTISPECIES: FRG domain-containing protein [unclassified Luteibacter]
MAGRDAKAKMQPVTAKSPRKVGTRLATPEQVPLPKPTPVTSVAQFIAELDKLKYVSTRLWYRGIGNAEHTLIPSLFRHPIATTQSALKELELNLNDTFEMRSLPYAESRDWSENEWERLFFMQHYRVPTRLLDWSGSPLISMHFAVTSAQLDKDGTALTDAAVWVLDPERWNNAAYADTGFPGGVLSAKDTWLKRYSPSEVYTSTSTLPPMAMRGVHNSARIVAQQGFFTVFGPQVESMETAFKWIKSGKRVFPDDALRKFVVPRRSVTKIRDEIFSLGISESTIYPDLEGLAAELKRTLGF